ncbi:methylenetetrahydrofolate reductase [Galleria mellonella]|uniref:Methylenetetrahydrofolate reductase n=1 Tax=Galleria mellonella TaxID=7137 RepID=A0A6J1WFQ7_GALME|nr:methylenetetrahydrofolate reductase [Galleria mellonella]
MAKIIDIIKRNKQFSFSFEVTPDISEEEIDNLRVDPSFFSITWHAKTHQNKDLDIAPLKIAKFLRSKEKEVLLHLSCDFMKRNFLFRVLLLLQEINIRNLFIILGEGFDPETSDFKDSSELIKCIRDHSGPYFCIGVAGLPDCNDDKLIALKRKINLGADFVLTQAFFEANIYKTFVHRCKKIDINVPIIPGIFYFETYTQLSGFINMCQIKVSDNILEYVKNDQSNKITGGDIIKQLIRDINDEKIYHVHFFTMNKLRVISDFVNKLY